MHGHPGRPAVPGHGLARRAEVDHGRRRPYRHGLRNRIARVGRVAAVEDASRDGPAAGEAQPREITEVRQLPMAVVVRVGRRVSLSAKTSHRLTLPAAWRATAL